MQGESARFDQVRSHIQLGDSPMPSLNLLHPAQTAPHHSVRIKWLPVLFSLAFICFTSTTFMGGSHTQVVVNAIWKAVLGKWHFDATGVVNGDLRKVGHFFGYGMIGIFFRNAWFSSVRALTTLMRSWLMPFAASLAIASTFVVACLDEWHQRYLQGRNGCFHDVLLDTAGALVLNLAVWAVRARRRRRTLSALQPAHAI
jgi:VanZ family protein